MRVSVILVVIGTLLATVVAIPAPCGPNTPPVDITDTSLDKRQCGVTICC
ncbi:hypothetical protein K474DRAFT_1710750 [Panus rudis PR-1116 ss-1]|nr:hypothetical protein K474DRAFT_1710750 [Panus rudis PR-1116 ss-1]